MVKGFSDNEVKNDTEIKESKKEKKGKYFWINSIRLKYDFNIASHTLFK